MPFFEPEYLLRVFLVFVRIGALLLTAPFFNHPSFPVRLRVLFSAIVAYAIVGLVPGELPPNATSSIGMMLAVSIEAVTGAVIGFAGQFVVWAVDFAGEIIGFQMGLSIAQTFNPISGHASNPLNQLLTMTFLLVFVLLEGHHLILRAVIGSFDVVPLAGARLHLAGPFLLQWTGGFFRTALQLAAPFMVTYFLLDTALGVLARVAPSADLFAISLPLKLILGLGMAVIFMQYFFPVLPQLIETQMHDIMRLIEVLIP